MAGAGTARHLPTLSTVMTSIEKTELTLIAHHALVHLGAII